MEKTEYKEDIKTKILMLLLKAAFIAAMVISLLKQ